jgi:hypothetical protein
MRAEYGTEMREAEPLLVYPKPLLEQRNVGEMRGTISRRIFLTSLVGGGIGWIASELLRSPAESDDQDAVDFFAMGDVPLLGRSFLYHDERTGKVTRARFCNDKSRSGIGVKIDGRYMTSHETICELPDFLSFLKIGKDPKALIKGIRKEGNRIVFDLKTVVMMNASCSLPASAIGDIGAASATTKTRESFNVGLSFQFAGVPTVAADRNFSYVLTMTIEE